VPIAYVAPVSDEDEDKVSFVQIPQRRLYQEVCSVSLICIMLLLAAPRRDCCQRALQTLCRIPWEMRMRGLAMVKRATLEVCLLL